MKDYKFPTKEEYKELDELMTYILDEIWGSSDKELVREGITMYADKWHEVQSNTVNTKAFKWDDNKVIDFVNWYIKLHKLDLNYLLENKNILKHFKSGGKASDWHSD